MCKVQELSGYVTYSSAQNCFKDGIVLILSFLTLADTVSASQSCHKWLAASYVEPCKNFKWDLINGDSILDASRSRLRHHVYSVNLSSRHGTFQREHRSAIHQLSNLRVLILDIRPSVVAG